LIFSL